MKESSARTRILDVASRLFYQQGYNLTGINQIIDEAEIARASLYNHFPSKADLLAAYLKEAEEQWFAGLNTYLLRIKDPKKKLLALFDYRAHRQLKSDFAGCQFIKISAEIPRDDTGIFQLITHQKNRLKVFIKEIIAEIHFDKQQLLSNELLTETLFLLMEGATVSAAIYKDTTAMMKAKKIARKLL